MLPDWVCKCILCDPRTESEVFASSIQIRVIGAGISLNFRVGRHFRLKKSDKKKLAKFIKIKCFGLETCWFEYIFVPKSEKIKIWIIHKDYDKCQNTLRLYTLKALLSKNQFYFFFLILWHAPIPVSIGTPCYWH